MSTKPELSFSVTELVNFACREGDMDGFGEGGPSAIEGIRGHQWLQKKRQKNFSDYQAEVKLEHQLDWQGTRVTLRGRIDGCRQSFSPTDEARIYWLEEIKTTYLEPEQLSLSTTSVQLAQLKIYAWMLCVKQQTNSIQGLLSWLSLRDYQIHEQAYDFNFSELEVFAARAIDVYCQWLAQVEAHRDGLRRACQALEFPFDNYRPQQRALCAEVYRSIRDQQHLLFEAPTGVGKSISTLFPAYKAIGEGEVKQIAFLTAKSSGRIAALTTCQSLETSKVKAKVLVINAKDKTCFCANQPQQRGEICPYKQGFYDKINRAMAYCFSKSRLDHRLISEAAEKFKVCPFSLSLQLVPWVDVIIADYNYVLDPLVQLAHFINRGKQIAFLIDEAHNLIDRSRQMYSAELSESMALDNIVSQGQSGRGKTNALSKQVNRLTEHFMRLESLLTPPAQSKNVGGDRPEKFQPKEIQTTLSGLASTSQTLVAELIEKTKTESLSQAELQWLKQLIRFNVIEALAGPHHACFLNTSEQRRGGKAQGLISHYQFDYLALTAADYLAKLYQVFASVIFFSGTLTPQNYIRQTLGIDASVRFLKLDPLFKSEQLKVLRSRQIDTRYRFRDQSIDQIVESIYCTRQARHGNYLACFTSYGFMRQVIEAYQEKYPDEDFCVQSARANQADKEAFVQRFFQQQGLLGFVIMGGSFTEGIDFKSDALHGVIIVGTGLPQLGEVQNAIKADFEGQGLNGFDMAYRFPGLQRVLQTAGRVIRSESDKGVIVLLDRRFAERQNSQYFPDNWQVESYLSDIELVDALSAFWSTGSTGSNRAEAPADSHGQGEAGLKP